jgi:hypothetical protein
MSLVKFTNRSVHRGKKLHWGRSAQDGLPYRGAFAPMLTEEEHEDRLVRVGDPQHEVFDLSDPDQKAAYLQVVDGIINGWFKCLYRRMLTSKKNPKKAYVRIEWVEYFMEDGHPTPYMSPGMMELANGNQQFLLPPGAQGAQ